jgi:hypothetical protein
MSPGATMNFRNLFGSSTEEPEPSLPNFPERRSGEERRTTNTEPVPERRTEHDRRELLHDTGKIVQQYSRIPVFRGLSKDQIMRMLRICSKQRIPAATTVYRAGQESRDMYILLKGNMKVVLSIGETWVTITPPGTVGEMGLFTGDPRSIDVIAETECIVLKINRTELFKVFDTDKDLFVSMLLNVIKDLSDKLRHDHDEIVNLHYRLRALDQI